MYEVDPSVREVLLVDLIERVEDGAHRLRRLADFLLAYLDRTGPGQRPEVRHAHQWIAWSYLAPEKVVDDMSALLTEISPGSGVAPALAHQLEVATMVEIVREPLAESLPQDAYQNVVETAQLLAHYWYRDKRIIDDVEREAAWGRPHKRARILCYRQSPAVSLNWNGRPCRNGKLSKHRCHSAARMPLEAH